MKFKLTIILILMIFASSFIYISCTKNNKDEIYEDLFIYINEQLTPIIPLEEEALNNYRSIVGDNYKSDEESIIVLDRLVIPKYTSFLTELEKITPSTKEVKELHSMYLNASKKQLECFQNFKIGLEKKDVSLVRKYNKILTDSRNEVKEFHSKLVELANKHGIDIN